MSSERYSIGIVGLGRIGAGYDYGLPEQYVFTHARAARLHHRARLVWGVDTDPAAREKFTAAYGVQSFPTVAEALRQDRPAIAVVAVPPAARNSCIPALLKSRPKLLLVEKPLAHSYKEAMDVTRACADAGMPLAVNYIRRFSPAGRGAREIARSGSQGQVVAGNVWYTKGMFNNASHLINLIIYILGQPTECRGARLVRSLDFIQDVDAEFAIYFRDACILFRPLDYQRYAFAEIDLLFERGRMRLGDHAFRLEISLGLTESSVPSYHELKPMTVHTESGSDRYQYNVLDSLIASLDAGEDLHQESADAVSTVEICEQVVSALR